VNADRPLLLRLLRQRLEWGERELFLDTLWAEEARAALARAAEGVWAGRPAAAALQPAEAAGARRTAQRGAAARLPPDTAPGGALAAAPAAGPGAAAGLAVLAREARGCTRCRLAGGRRTVVFGEGNPAAEVVVVGEGPGYEEDRSGRPFVGPAGRLLDLLLLSVGLPRETVYICNVVKCRPPRNREPEPDEVAACLPYLRAQLAAIGPRAVLAVGKVAAQTLLATEESIGRLRGRVHRCGETPVVATFHPAFLLRSPQWTRAAWWDFQLLRQVLDGDA